MSDKPMILLDAAAFCFGPVSTLSAVVQHLPRDTHRLVLLASGTTLAFASANLSGVRVIECDTDSREALLNVAGLFRQAELFISNTNPVSARVAMELGTRVAYIDTLFWMWDDIDPILFEAEAYIAQDFIGSERNLRRFGGKINNLQMVGPLVAPAVQTDDTPDASCVISFGGQQSGLTPLETIARPARFLTRTVLEAARRAQYRGGLSFRGNRQVMDRLAAEFDGPGREFGYVPHEAHIRSLRRAERQFLSPGLTGVFEAIENSVPGFLLLGQNYSQELQSQSIKEDGRYRDLFSTVVTWGDIYPSDPVARFLPEAEGVRQIQRLWDTLLADPEAAERYCRHVQTAFESLPKRRKSPALAKSGAWRAAGIVSELLAETMAVP